MPFLLVPGCLAAVLAHTVPAAPVPLHQRIDQLIAAGASGSSAASITSDAEFLRRVSLDLTGTIPTAAEARAFLADTDPHKRARLIDQLLASPEHARHLAHVFDVWLMDRRRDVQVPHAAWLEYLRGGFAANKPYDVLVRELLAA